MTFKAQCASCQGVFAYPELGESAYGEFLFTGDEGTEYCYFNAWRHPIWRLVDSTLAANVTGDDRGGTLQAICAALADPQNGQRFVNGRVCPLCRSSHWKWWDGEKVGEIEVPEATYNLITALSHQEQVASVRAALADMRPNTSCWD